MQIKWKYSNYFSKLLGLVIVIYYALIDINYGILFGICYMIYLILYKDTYDMNTNNTNNINESFENNDVEFFINKPKESISSDKKYTAVIIEPRKHKALEFVLNNFMENLDDDWGFIIFHSNTNKKMVENIMDTNLKKYKNKTKLINLNIDSNDFTIKEYSTLFYDKTFYDYIPTETFLIFQTDSIILKENKDKINDFLQYDYVGAPWPKTMGILGKMEVGNGGLSLRKKSKMLELLKYKNKYNDSIIAVNDERKFGKYIAEDKFFNGYYVNEVYINKPSFNDSKNFSVECIFYDSPFGIHKPWVNYGLTKSELNILKNKYPDIVKLINLQSIINY
jgi:hypothetical protein